MTCLFAPSLIFVIIAGYFFSERNDRKMFLLSSLVFLVINIACLYVLTASLWFLCGAIMGNDSNLLIVFYVQIMPDDFVMQLHRF